MEVTVKTFASLRAYLPDGAKTFDVPCRTTVADLLDILDLPAQQVHIMIRNNRQAEGEETLEPGDTVAFFPPIAGGD